MRAEYDSGTYAERSVLDGARGWTWNSRTGSEELSGVRLAEVRLEHPFVPIADWRALYREIRVLARVAHEGEEEPAFVVRAEPELGNAHTWLVSDAGLPLMLATITHVPGMGEVGGLTRYSDWRDVGPLRLPFRSAGRFATPMLGDFELRWEAVENGVELPEDAFVER
jgi:hypothetical protein